MAVHVELVSPERVVFSGEADMVIARTVGGGDIAFMAGHTPFLGALEVATATIARGDREEQVAVHGGFVEVTTEVVGDEGGAAGGAAGGPGGPGDEAAAARRTVITILSDTAELSGEIDIERAQIAKERAQQQLQDTDDAEGEAALRRAHVRLAAAEK